MMFEAVNKGQRIPDHLIRELPDRAPLLADLPRLREVLAEEGYVLLRNVLPVADVMAARQEVADRLASVGELREPAIDGIVTGVSQRDKVHPDLGAFWKTASEGEKLRSVTHGARMREILGAIHGAPAVGHDLVYLRVAAPGRALDMHYDYPFFAKGTPDLYTVWTPLGDVPVTDGPLFIIDKSNTYRDLIDDVVAAGETASVARKLAYNRPAYEFAEERHTSIMCADLHAGDIIVFSLFTAHGSLDNCSPINRARMSCDVRYQRADMPRDPRYFGENPVGYNGKGYADLNGSKPLTASWITN
ncbi:phytanoyl-CoA dioxygenase family protein [Labrys monachus]|uniref:Ectoine hydroxylase-related dioxygenase (Phytanoyl-CoA dioxygenase family) n=1 Tax=Labrys monachus TaxID=217067 RepID=A0ABU0FNL4_9HYPH|nr:phytanoyl-CoA dioxygenase family protein [Labrys monachus]MDQ0396204.1 ectoine hydroxylase-related dioxygenase (phytanoyl-CoA dioxygenase family) [Labrys monachus]